MMDFDQYIDIFLDESKDHLQNLNEALLRLEEDPENLDTVNEIFRMAHTLKGMSATMGFEIIAKLTHKMENILDGIRSHKFTLNRDMIDILFEGLDILEGQVKTIESDGKEQQIDISDIINRLDVLEKGGSLGGGAASELNKNTVKETEDSTQSSDLSFEISKEDKEALYASAKEMLKDGYNLYKIEVDLEENSMLKSARAFIVFKNLEDAGEVIYSHPSSDDIEKDSFEGYFTILLLTHETIDEIKSSIEGVSEVEKVSVDNFDIELLNSEKEEEKEEKQEQPKETVQAPQAQQPKKEEPKKPAQATKAPADKKAKSGKTIRVDIDRLDNLMNLVSELIIVKTRLEDNEIFSKRQNMTEAIEYLERITTSLHDAVTKVRMVPIERVFNRFPRMVRDLSKDLNKEINLIMAGEETEVDRTVIDEIGDPLVHLLRNSADHGIESPEDRIAKGKPEVGTVRLIAYQDGNTVVIEVTDDGAGINTEKVKQKAIERGILTQAQADELEINKAAELIFAAGFSTADKISDVSGRGVGLDVVKTKIESLSGTVEVRTEKDKGSAFIIRLPLTLAIIQALLVIVGNEKYAIPLNNIKEITNIDTIDIRNIEDKEIILYRGVPLELKRMSEVLDCENQERKEGNVTVVIVRKGEKDIGLIIDSLIGQQEIVIKSLGPYLSFVKLIAGATILGNGGVALIIDTNEIF
ncbi:putative chemotaxis protein CheA [Peptoanaerobacter stomatis]|uniref:Chemotaxis protein CheA n=1 Tax=Peptoanaerobacter stomatis TaxID=796937 RepID=J5UCR0_9FIRM|nr:chemotaxis protein CheA [Peptoanaerobacter stomatis]EJU21544.1 putative chemotaxis protein CheA [Peptoanaerobacter stomatis]NWO24761.1 chemotaxis protein CheA [Peptostreptococcaceae bacterium oral taxon 081]